MNYKVELALFQDDANGEYGLAHKNAIDVETPFNAFWSHQGIFHDVFEHYFEQNHPYFMGDFAFNVGGEVSAMGHLAYLWNNFGIEERKLNRNSIYSFEQNIIGSTTSEMIEAIKYGYARYGNELLCNIPYVKPSNNYIEDIIYQHWSEIKDIKPTADFEDEMQTAIIYKKSVTKSKLQRLYRWGYNEAASKFPNTNHNFDQFNNFLEFWKKATSRINAEEMFNIGFRQVNVLIKTGEEMTWSIELIDSERNKFIMDSPDLDCIQSQLNFDE